ncbi:MAG: hypothetical protein PVJ64_13955 [Gemmatimonadales bacterium]
MDDTMRFFLGVLFVSLSGVASAQEKGPELQIRETLRALPEALRDGATVIGYEDGERRILKTGSGEMICWADDPSLSDARGAFFVNCFPKSLEAFENRRAELALNPDLLEILRSEVESGRLKVPEMAIRYTLRGHAADGAVPLAVLHVPFATARSTGLSTEPDHFRPWLMGESTVMAHLMLPGQ